VLRGLAIWCHSAYFLVFIEMHPHGLLHRLITLNVRLPGKRALNVKQQMHIFEYHMKVYDV